MTPRGYRFYQRKFLNQPGHYAGAYVLAEVGSHGSSGTLTITDCNRLVRLDFDTYSPGDRRNSLHKADVLIQTLTELRAALAETNPGRGHAR